MKIKNIMNNCREKILMTILLLSCVLCAHTQTKSFHPFSLTVRINGVSDGAMEVIYHKSTDKDLRLNHQSFAVNKDAGCVIDGTITYPHYVFLRYHKDSISEGRSQWLFIDTGQQTLIFANLDSFSRSDPGISNNKAQEYYVALLKKEEQEHTPLFDGVADNIVANKGNPFVNFGIFYNRVLMRGVRGGYNYRMIFDHFPDEVKNTDMGKQLLQKMSIVDSTLSVGKTFPLSMQLVDTAIDKTDLSKIVAAHRYTLIDFWFVNCVPCMSAFAEWRAMQASGKETLPYIVTISIDKQADQTRWLECVNNRLPAGSHLWDVDGKNAAYYMINSFPATFLLDREGKILEINPTIETIRKYETL